ncbi:MAG TPA: amino acid ABC transporter substrate-binding protein [Burkholderiales bacterium]|nr:amino acid ABC transporter substrate-binding protein [Burkholderiales bacterium]
MGRLTLSLLLTLALSFKFDAFAAEPSDTVSKIKQSGVITLGVRESSVPFSFVEAGQSQAKGYAVELCMRVVDTIRKELKLPKLEVKQVVVKPADRIPKLLDGTIDLECGSTTNTVARQEQVAFSLTTFMTGTRFLIKKSSGIKSFEELKGKTIVTTAGTNNEKIVTKFVWDQALGATMKSVKDHAEAFSMVKSGQATAFAMDDVLLAGLKSKSGAPDEYEIIGTYLSIDPYALMLRKNDAAFMTLVDSTLTEIFHSGELAKTYAKWFVTKELDFPMPRLMKEAIKVPTKEPAWPK